METVCNVCDGTEFTVNAGFYYCDNCGQRTTVLQEVEDHADGQFDDIQKKSHRIKPVAQAHSELTFYMHSVFVCVFFSGFHFKYFFLNTKIRHGTHVMGNIQLHFVRICERISSIGV